jgi:signal transduction histidine kinase
MGPEPWPRRSIAGPPLSEPERARVLANLRVSLSAGVGGCFLGLVANSRTGRADSVVPLGVLAVALVFGLYLVRRGWPTAAGAFSLASIVASIDAMAVLGQGVHDRSLLILPVVILVAGLTFDRRLLAATTGACVLSAAAITRLESTGMLAGSVSFLRLGWLPFVDMTIIFAVTAVTVDLLVSDVRRGMREAREKGERLAEANRELEARNAELERFAHLVSHDLKSPLVTVRGYLDHVEQDARDGRSDRLAADVGRIRAATARMGQLLDDLLELSRAGRLMRSHQDVPLAEVVSEARALVEGRLTARGVRLEVQDPMPVVRGDRARLLALVQNLLENAAKFMGGQEAPLVRVTAGPAGPDGHVEVAVSDNGIGIAPDHHERIFEPFHRLDPRLEGTGLGLALSRRIVEAHGGRLFVESEGEGRGATFRFTLPGGARSGGGPAAGSRGGPAPRSAR